MPTDINFLLRKWAFDMESEAFGTLRIGKIDIEKFFKEHEEAIRSGDLEGAQLARMLLENTARKLTGDGVVDKQCEGPLLESSEVALLQDDELDRFSDALVKGRLWFVVPAGSPMPPQSQGGGCAVLAKELIRFADGAKANRAKMLVSIKKDLYPSMTPKMPLSATEQVTALWKQTAAATAGLTAISGFEAARARQEAQLGLDLGPGSTIGKAVKEWERQEQLSKVAMGYVGESALAASIAQFQKDEKLTSTALGHLSDMGIAKWVQQHDREEKRLKEMMGATHAAALGFQNLSAAERIGIATGGRSTLDDIAGPTIYPAVIAQASLPNPFLAERPVFEFHSIPFIPPINPAHETNKIVGELLEHQKETDAKKEQAEVKKEAESIVATETSKLGLRYTKAGFWSAVVIAVLSMGITLWVYFDQKADAAENAKAAAANEKVAAAEIAKQRAENRELIELLRKSIESRTSPAPAVKKSGQK